MPPRRQSKKDKEPEALTPQEYQELFRNLGFYRENDQTHGDKKKYHHWKLDGHQIKWRQAAGDSDNRRNFVNVNEARSAGAKALAKHVAEQGTAHSMYGKYYKRLEHHAGLMPALAGGAKGGVAAPTAEDQQFLNEEAPVDAGGGSADVTPSKKRNILQKLTGTGKGSVSPAPPAPPRALSPIPGARVTRTLPSWAAPGNDGVSGIIAAQAQFRGRRGRGIAAQRRAKLGGGGGGVPLEGAGQARDQAEAVKKSKDAEEVAGSSAPPQDNLEEEATGDQHGNPGMGGGGVDPGAPNMTDEEDSDGDQVDEKAQTPGQRRREQAMKWLEEQRSPKGKGDEKEESVKETSPPPGTPPIDGGTVPDSPAPGSSDPSKEFKNANASMAEQVEEEEKEKKVKVKPGGEPPDPGAAAPEPPRNDLDEKFASEGRAGGASEEYEGDGFGVHNAHKYIHPIAVERIGSMKQIPFDPARTAFAQTHRQELSEMSDEDLYKHNKDFCGQYINTLRVSEPYYGPGSARADLLREYVELAVLSSMSKPTPTEFSGGSTSRLGLLLEVSHLGISLSDFLQQAVRGAGKHNTQAPQATIGHTGVPVAGGPPAGSAFSTGPGGLPKRSTSNSEANKGLPPQRGSWHDGKEVTQMNHDAPDPHGGPSLARVGGRQMHDPGIYNREMHDKNYQAVRQVDPNVVQLRLRPREDRMGSHLYID